MKSIAYMLVFDGFADWEAGLAACEISKKAPFKIVTVGFSSKPVTSMGGLRVTPDITLSADFLRGGGGR
jgi:hypothetical protein